MDTRLDPRVLLVGQTRSHYQLPLIKQLGHGGQHSRLQQASQITKNGEVPTSHLMSDGDDELRKGQGPQKFPSVITIADISDEADIHIHNALYQQSTGAFHPLLVLRANFRKLSRLIHDQSWVVARRLLLDTYHQ